MRQIFEGKGQELLFVTGQRRSEAVFLASDLSFSVLLLRALCTDSDYVLCLQCEFIYLARGAAVEFDVVPYLFSLVFVQFVY